MFSLTGTKRVNIGFDKMAPVIEKVFFTQIKNI